MPKQVNPVSVLHPSMEMVTSSRVKLMRARKHIQKLNNEGLNGLLGTSLKAVETLERVIKKELERR